MRRPAFARVTLRRLAAQSGGGGGSITEIDGVPPISVAGGTGPTVTISHANSGIGAGTVAYPASLSYDAKGHLTAATPAAAGPILTLTPASPITLTGPAQNPTIGHATSGVTGTGVAYPTALGYDADGHLTSVTGGSQPVTSATAPITAASGVAGINNSGNTAGRAGLQILIDRQTLAAASAYSSPTWTAGKYRRLILEMKGLSGAGLAFGNVTLVGLTGTPSSFLILNTTNTLDNRNSAATAWFFAGGTIDFFSTTYYDIENNGQKKSFLTSGESMSATTNWLMHGGGDFPDTANDVTQLTIGMAATDGVVTLWGVP